MTWFEIVLVVLTAVHRPGLAAGQAVPGQAPRRARRAARRGQGAGRWSTTRKRVLPGAGDRADPAQLRGRAVPDPVQLDDADPADRRLHPGQQVRLRPAPAGHQQEVRRPSASRSAATWWCSATRPQPMTRTRTDCIKRVIGLPGDRIGYHDNQVFVNGEPVAYEPLGTYVGKGQGADMTGADSIARESARAAAHRPGTHRFCRSSIQGRATGRCRRGTIS